MCCSVSQCCVPTGNGCRRSSENTLCCFNDIQYRGLGLGAGPPSSYREEVVGSVNLSLPANNGTERGIPVVQLNAFN